MPGTGLAKVLYWIGLLLAISGGLCINVIGARTQSWFVRWRPWLSDLDPLEMKLAKIGGVLFFIGVLVALLAFIVEIKGL